MRSHGPGLYSDPSVEPLHVRISGQDIIVHPDHVAALFRGGWDRLWNLYIGQPDGDYVFAEAILEAPDHEILAEGNEVARALQFTEPADESHCQFPPCILPTEAKRVGYSLCAHHDEVLTYAAEVDRANPMQQLTVGGVMAIPVFSADVLRDGEIVVLGSSTDFGTLMEQFLPDDHPVRLAYHERVTRST